MNTALDNKFPVCSYRDARILLKDNQKPSRIILWFYPEGSTTIERADLMGLELSRVHPSGWKWGDTEAKQITRYVI